MTTLKRFGAGLVVGFLLATLFSAPWIYQAWAVGSCSVFRTWNTGDSVTAADLNSSFTTAAVTNSTPQCLDDYSATATQMQATTDPFASGTESLATSTAGELERLRFMFKQVFGLTQWYRHDQAPMFAASHITAGALHLGSTGVPGGTDAAQNRFLARFPVLTGPDHWTGFWWPHNTAHIAISIRDANHAAGGVQGGIELFRFHAGGLVLHHTTALMFRHSLIHSGAHTHITALSIDGATDQLILGHAGGTIRIVGNGIAGGSGQSLRVAADGQLSTGSAAASIAFTLKPESAILPNDLAPTLAKHAYTSATWYGLMYHASLAQAAHYAVMIPPGFSPSTATITVYSLNHTALLGVGTIGWHVGVRVVQSGAGNTQVDGAFTVHTLYPIALLGPDHVLAQTETLTNTLATNSIIYLYIQRNSGSTAAEATEMLGATLLIQ